ncbi:MAG: hypothetical protein H6Q90_5480 [Deltaproteobacteria bacterium]|nr:hypothetical protein [Deltaproteobacteria bacterium]
MKRTMMLTVVVLLAACGSKKDKGADDPKGSGDTAPAADKPPATSKSSADDLFAGPKVSFPPPVAKLALDMPEAEAKAAAPDVLGAKYGYKVPGYKGVEITAQITDGRLFQIYMKIDEPIETVGAYLEKKWGKPRATKNSIGNPELWFDSPDVGLRAKLETYATKGSMLRYYRVMSNDQLFGTDPKLWGFEKAPLIGMTQDELMKAFAAYNPQPRKEDPTSIVITFPALTTSEYNSSIDARIKGGKVSGFSMNVSSGGDAATDAALVARLEQLYGKGKPAQVSLYTDFPGPPKAKAEIRKDSASFGHTVWVGDYKK